MPDAALQTLARETGRYAAGLRELSAHLPASDADLAAAVHQAVADRDEDAFAHMLLAALHAGRKVDGRILEHGAALLPLPGMLVAAVVHCTSDVGSALLTAVRGARLSPGAEAMALALAAWWSRERGGCEIPAEAIRHGRVLARHPGSLLATDMLLVLNDLAGDPDLAGLLEDETWATELARREFDRSIEQARENPLRCVPDERPPTVLSGYTVRRAVARVGRNDPCPCGSGKKYKRCCFDRDRERLRHSSDVEGLTVEELRENPEPHLTLQRLQAMSCNDLARIDATRIDPELLRPLIRRLTNGRDFDAVARVFESTGCAPEMDDDLLEAIDYAADLGQPAALKRLLALRGDPGEDGETLRLAARIMAEGLEPGPMLELIESTARAGLDEELEPVELAYGLLSGPCPTLGILVTRGVLWTANQLDGWALLQELLETRDRLGLSPVDPVEDPVEAYWNGVEPDRVGQDDLSAAEEETRQELVAKLAEARRLRSELRERDDALRKMEQKLEQLEARGAHREPADGDAPAAEPGGQDAELVVELRRKLAERKAEVKRKHTERNQLRAELARARREVESLRVRSLEDTGGRDGAGGDPAEADDESLTIPAESAANQPPRLPRFERQFADDLRGMPVAVARSALSLIGRLAAGESAAFHGARRLSGNRDVWRQRVGLSHRLLFRTEADALIVLSLVTRQDFARAVRSL